MSVVMAMVWEYVFTRYLFGMDRDQRKKLKAAIKGAVSRPSSANPTRPGQKQLERAPPDETSVINAKLGDDTSII